MFSSPMRLAPRSRRWPGSRLAVSGPPPTPSHLGTGNLRCPPQPQRMPQPPVREKSPALDRRADPASEYERLGIRDVDDLVNAHPLVPLRVAVGEGQPRGPAPVAPPDELGVTALDPHGQRVARLDLQPLSTPNAGPVRRPPILEHDALAALVYPGVPELVGVVGHGNEPDVADPEPRSEIFEPFPVRRSSAWRSRPDRRRRIWSRRSRRVSHGRNWPRSLPGRQSGNPWRRNGRLGGSAPRSLKLQSG
jgi:hypothetical protein